MRTLIALNALLAIIMLLVGIGTVNWFAFVMVALFTANAYYLRKNFFTPVRQPKRKKA